MTAGDVTPGRRREWGTKVHDLEPGDYMYRTDDGGAVTGVWVRLPGGGGDHGPCCLTKWAPVAEPGGELTLSPSILAMPHALGPLNKFTPGQPYTVPEWHGYLERGQWREV